MRLATVEQRLVSANWRLTTSSSSPLKNMIKATFLALFAAFFGTVLCLWGYRIFMVMLPVWSFFAGLWMGMKGVFLIFGEGFLSGVTGLTLGVILGVVLSLLSWQFFEIGAAILGAIIGAWFGSGIMHALGFSAGGVTSLVALACAAVAGILTYVNDWQKYVVIILTSIFGANAITLAILLPLGRVSIAGLQGAGNAIRPILQDSWFWSLVWLALVAVGIGVQTRNYQEVTFDNREFVKYWN